MPTVNFILKNGSSRAVECAETDSVMQAATNNGVPGIEAICGGFCNCATCHVYVDESWIDKLPPMSSDEDEMLDGTASDRKPTSRLSCQIKMTPELDALVVHMPERQA